MSRSPIDRLVVCVMAGGSGTRFWPVSRTARPKQLLPLLDGATLLGATIDRVAELCPPERTLVVTAERLADATRAALPGLPPEQVLAEPTPRNTAPCLGLAAIAAAQLAPDAILCLLPADHHVADGEAFRAALATAAHAVADGGIATLGVVPTHPETGYGYIEVGRDRGDGSSDVVRFVEKPDLPRAMDFLAGGRHLWNAGIFLGRADVLLAAVDATLPALGEALRPLRNDAAGPYHGPAFRDALAACFGASPSISIDHGIMEHRDDLCVVPLQAGWSDVGSWRNVRDLGVDDEGNYRDGDTFALDCRDCVVVSDGPFVAAICLQGAGVVARGDAVLVLPLDRSQDVRAVVAELQARGRHDLL